MSYVPISEHRGRPIQEYLDFDADANSEINKACHSAKIVKSERSHLCFVPRSGKFREVPAKTLMLFEKAKIDGVWASVWTTLDDIDDYIKWEEAQR